MADPIVPKVVISMPAQLFTLANSFSAAKNGRIYIGKVDSDPSIASNQIQVYIQGTGSVAPVVQPISINAGGYPVSAGQIAKFVTTEAHSLAVYDEQGVRQFYFPNVLKYDPDQLNISLGQADGAGRIGAPDYKNSPSTVLAELGTRDYVVDSVADIANVKVQVKSITVRDEFTGGKFLRADRSMISESWLPDGKMVIRDGLGQLWARVIDGGVDPEWFGALPEYFNAAGQWVNRNVDNQKAFQAASDWCTGRARKNYGNWQLPAMTLKCKPGRRYGLGNTWSRSTSILFEGNSVQLYATEGFNTSEDNPKPLTLLQNVESGNMNRANFINMSRDFELYNSSPLVLGNSINKGVILELFDGPGDVNDDRNSRHTIQNARYYYGFRGTEFRNRAYLITHSNCFYSGNTNHIWSPTGTKDSGENITFTESTFTNGGSLSMQAGNFNFYACSFDYLKVPFIVGSGDISVYGGHVETARDNINPRVLMTDGLGALRFHGTTVYGTWGSAQAPCFILDTGSDAYSNIARVTFNNVNFENMAGFTDGFHTGLGLVDYINCRNKVQGNINKLNSLDGPSNRMGHFQSGNNPRAYLVDNFSNQITQGSAFETAMVSTSGFTGKALSIKKTRAVSSGSQVLYIPFPMGEGRYPYLDISASVDVSCRLPLAISYAASLLPVSFETNKLVNAFADNIRPTKYYGASNLVGGNKQVIMAIFGNAVDLQNPGVGPSMTNYKGFNYMLLGIDLAALPVGATITIGDINFNYM